MSYFYAKKLSEIIQFFILEKIQTFVLDKFICMLYNKYKGI